MREKQQKIKNRITPAYTGKSDDEKINLDGYEDHPRIHGEKVKGMVEYTKQIGSPPHTRGKVQLISKQIQLIGITPAYTGKR